MYTQQTPDHTRTEFPPHLEIDFELDSGATLNVLNNNTWNEINFYFEFPYIEFRCNVTLFILCATLNVLNNDIWPNWVCTTRYLTH